MPTIDSLSGTAYHSSFTPSQSDGPTLERLFVARHEIARDLVEGIRTSASSGNKLQQLLVGPRGIGKTHLVALVHHRVQAEAALAGQLCIAWLAEDPYVATYADLVLEILRRLAQDEHIAGLPAEIDRLLDQSQHGGHAPALEALLLRSIGSRTLLLIVENLDDLLQAIGDAGQRELRAFVQNSRQVTILATTTSLVNTLADRRSIFFGFFKTTPLLPMTARQASDMLIQLACRNGDAELELALQSPMGRARIRAVHLLAGGNPRVYALFFDFLSRQSLDNLVTPFMKLIDELTPYYQARMSRLAPLQRRIVDVLRQLRGAATVKDIARQTMKSSQTISSQLGKLRDLGYVTQADALGRNSYYELREPLMRLCLDVKEMRGRSVELFIEFLRVWHSQDELQRLSLAVPEGLDRTAFNLAAERVRVEGDPVLASALADLQRLDDGSQPEAALEALQTALLRGAPEDSLLERKARLLRRLGRPLDEQLAAWAAVSDANPDISEAWNAQAVLLHDAGRMEEALAASQRALAVTPNSSVLLNNQANILQQLNRGEEARAVRQRAIDKAAAPRSADDWLQRALQLAVMDQPTAALAAWEEALLREPAHWPSWARLLGWLQEGGRYALLQQLVSRLQSLMPDAVQARVLEYCVLMPSGRFEEALAVLEDALRRAPALDQQGELHPGLWRVMALGDLGRHQAALEALATLQGPPGDASYVFDCDQERASALMWLDRWDEGLAQLDALVARATPSLWGTHGPKVVTDLLRRTVNPAVWRRFIAACIDVFGRHGQLPQLGKALVWRIRALYTLPWVTPDLAQTWYACWAEAAAGIEALALPLRLLKAAVDYKADADPRVLLELPVEQRSLLEPWLPQLARHEGDEFERRLLDLVDRIDARLKERRTQAQRSQAWLQPVPARRAFDAAAGMVGAASTTPERDFPVTLLPGDWQVLDAAAAAALVSRLAREDETAWRALTRPGVAVHRVQALALTFSRWRLVQVHLQDGGRCGALDALMGEDGLCVLNGVSTVVHDLVSGGVVTLDNDEAASDYTRFFTAMLRSEQRFAVVTDAEQLQRMLREGGAAAPQAAITPWRSRATRARGKLRYTGSVLYDNTLHRVDLLLTRGTGQVRMSNAETTADDLPQRTEQFEGPLRFVDSPAG